MPIAKYHYLWYYFIRKVNRYDLCMRTINYMRKEALLMKKVVIKNVNYLLIRGGLVSLQILINKDFTSNLLNNIKAIKRTNRNISLSL